MLVSADYPQEPSGARSALEASRGLERRIEMKEEKPPVTATVVGGSLPGGAAQIGSIPRGIEVLVKKAAVDPSFKARLIEKRSAVAGEIELVLTAAEKQMLDTIPAAHLESIIANTKVNSKLIPILLTGTAAAILAALAMYAFGKSIREQLDAMSKAVTGTRPDMVQPHQPGDDVIRGTRP
jgi:hypothetical protein